ncbi:hypothetical protein ACIRL2_41600 [Embleya sp. NPDC127516]|uniref:hypothetical protein n=1 Tax=Embleya sp. NPDC127516 TaxID=3363990 RepID=UPI0037FD23F4
MSPTNTTPEHIDVTPFAHPFGEDTARTRPDEREAVIHLSTGGGKTNPLMAISHDFLQGVSEKVERARNDHEYKDALDRAADGGLLEYLVDDTDPVSRTVPTSFDSGPATRAGGNQDSEIICSPFPLCEDSLFAFGSETSPAVGGGSARERTRERERTWARACLGDAEAAYAHGRWLIAAGRTGDAEPWMARAAAHGHPDAAAFVGHGHERRRDPCGATLWYLRAAEAGSTLGAIALARIRYESGDSEQAIRILAEVLGEPARDVRELLDLLACARRSDGVEPKRGAGTAHDTTERGSSVEGVLARLLGCLTEMPPILHGDQFDLDVFLASDPLIPDHSFPWRLLRSRRSPDPKEISTLSSDLRTQDSRVSQKRAKDISVPSNRAYRMLDEIRILNQCFSLPAANAYPSSATSGDSISAPQYLRNESDVVSCP